MKYKEIRTVYSDKQLKETALLGHFNIKIGENDTVIVGTNATGCQFIPGRLTKNRIGKDIVSQFLRNEDIRIMGNYSEYKEHDGKLTRLLVIKKT